MKKRNSFGALVIVIVCLFILSGPAAELSADFVMQEKGKKEFTKRKIFVEDDNIRQEVMEELLMSEIIQLEALLDLLERKGIITEQELLREIKAVPVGRWYHGI